MRFLWLVIFSLLIGTPAISSAESQARKGQRLFAGCLKKVDDRATLKTGRFVCKGERDPSPFGGNGRACGHCHVPGDNFGISLERIASLPANDPFFFPGLEEDQRLLRSHGLVRVIVPNRLDEFRQTPKLVHLQTMCKKNGECDALGLQGDRVRDLCDFSVEAIKNHMARTPARVPGQDFRLPTRKECKWLVAYMLSDLVAEQDERIRKRR